MKIMIIGGGTTGLTLANLLGEDHEITIIEKEAEVAKDIADKTHALVVEGDGSDISILKDANFTEMDAIVTTADDKTNLMVCEIGKSEEIAKIISLVNEPKNEELFASLGIVHLVSVVGTNITAIKKLLYQIGDARIIAQIGQGEIQILELIIAEESRLVGKEAQIHGASISVIYRSGELLIPKQNTILEKGDLIIFVAKTVDLPKITDLITGK
ncbi:NAD-binding protein [Candidatus Peregrinibacteria bacterium]|nr:NAD-binding protein [Candidatus Peregrinibacteria bacterium]